MKLSEAELILSLPTVILSIVSFFSALYIAISAWLMHKVRQKKFEQVVDGINNYSSLKGVSCSSSMTHSHNPLPIYSPSQFHSSFYERPELICHHIFWMSICDALFSLWNVFIWFPKLFDIHLVDQSTISCKIFGIIEQFIMSSGVLWYLMVAWCLCSVLFGLNNHVNSTTANSYVYWNKLKKFHHFIVWSIALICTVIPLYPLDEYGKFENTSRDDVEEHDIECWISNQLYFISFYGLVGISLLFAIFLLMYISIRWNCPILRLCTHKSHKRYLCGIRFICCPKLCKRKRNKKSKKKTNHINDNNVQIQNNIDYTHKNVPGLKAALNNENIKRLDLCDTPQSESLSGLSELSNTTENDVLHFSQGYIFGGLSFNDGDMISRIELFTIIFILVWIGPFCVRMYNVFCWFGDDDDAPLWATCIHHYGISLLGLGNAIVWSKSKNFNSPFNSYKKINQQQQIQKDEEIVGQFNRAFSNI